MGEDTSPNRVIIVSSGGWEAEELNRVSTHEKSQSHHGSGLVCMSRPTLCDPPDCSPPGSSVHGILHARILEWVAISFSRASFRPKDRTQVSHIAGGFFIIWTTRNVQSHHVHLTKFLVCNGYFLKRLWNLFKMNKWRVTGRSSETRAGGGYF